MAYCVEFSVEEKKNLFLRIVLSELLILPLKLQDRRVSTYLKWLKGMLYTSRRT